MNSPADIRGIYQPNFAITLEGKALSGLDLHSIAEIEYRDSLEDLDGLALTIINWDPVKREPTVSEAGDWAPGKTVKLELGYRDDGTQSMITADITSVSPHFPAHGVPYLLVQARSPLAKFMKVQNTKVFLEQSDSDIARAIAGDLGVSITTSPMAGEPQNAYSLQWNCYDILFLMGRARRLGYELAAEPTSDGSLKLFFGQARGFSEEAYQLTYGKDLSSFEVEVDITDQVDKVTVEAWHPTDKVQVTASAARQDASSYASVSSIERPFASALSGREEVVCDYPVADDQAAKAMAQGVMDDIVKRMVSARGCTMGLPKLRAGTLIEVKGLGATYSGSYLVTGSVHRISDQGYQTEFTCRPGG